MYPQPNRRNRYDQIPRIIYYCLFLSCLVISIITAHPTFAHQVQISEDVGATIHIEPNDNPRAGEPTQAWFALTRKGGKVIPLTECDCELLIYAEPHTPGEPALIEPSLAPVSAERYQGIPGAEITFPKPGRYQLQLSGKPATEASFKPFQFKFEVTVATGTAKKSENVPDVNNNAPTQDMNFTSGLTITLLVLAILVALGIVFFILRMKKGRE
ncbi:MULTISPECIES: hypothetical protein [Cyanophyceae]|uniref:hypothetical protein n=1 Tax=Cyanophyceae TaxID=3028117 RepID=UPI00232B9BDB|nr:MULTISPECIES: hypothetical protein [Cyanophyceae]MDB9339896.1 hypothetical protein [Nodularia spumigena CS-589/07]MDB9400901.1 hypothetical protein [Microcystis aeruginosa CS-567/02-A1]MDB9499990.1 hypothetical protein [Nodularia spumigena CS-336/02]MDB9532970.1 hypothetical protein [Nodularia spumigena CS-1038]